ncbi:C-GCAxxG-C-C family protein [Balneolaceae bacterium ANBcel3]|nr:C-GCAxxG-C-C family protein [Balneolaceae bacterium ANBcel3]
MDRVQKADNFFCQGYNCAQSVAGAFIEDERLSRDIVFKLTNGFGGGMGRRQEVCGALSGAIMVLGLNRGRGVNDDKEKQEETYAHVRALMNDFQKVYGSVYCRDLLGSCDLSTSEGQRQFVEQGLKNRCREFIQYVIRYIDTNESCGATSESEQLT